MEPSEVDVAIIGSGISGIAFARFYLDTHPESELAILESDDCIGGAWSAKRVFDAFWVQSPVRQSHFCDVAFEIPVESPRLYDTFPARYVAQYLEEYVDNHVYNGVPLRSRIRLNARVHSIERIASGWMLHIKGAVTQSMRCKKLAVATGLTSEPQLPTFPRKHDFVAPVVHHRDFGVRSKSILAPSSLYQNVTILGGGKSAADMVYAALKAGKAVNWVIRKSGAGPGIFMNPAASGRYRHKAEAGETRNAKMLNPSGFHPMAEWALMLHQSVLKKEELNSKLFATDRGFKAWANYRGREGALPCFRDLEPKASFFWNSGPVGLIQHEEFWDLVSQKVNVYSADPSGTSTNAIILDDGREVPTDVVFCGTGWDTSYSFFSSAQQAKLGLPHRIGEDASGEEQLWTNLMKEADEQIIKQYPILAQPPPDCKPIGDTSLTPARLYHSIASLKEPLVVFLGRCRISNTFLSAEAQAIWATAYWDGHITIPPFEQAQREIAFMNAFSRRRYPSHGVDGVNFHTDLIWYTDRLISDAGLTSHRKEWWDDGDAPRLSSDLRDCKDEYIAKYGFK